MDSLDLLVILDRSGSMEAARADHEGGLRSFVRDQRDMAGDVRLTLVQFDSQDPCEIVFDRRPLEQVKDDDIRLIPRGGTPLLDAVGQAVAHLRQQLRGAAKVIVLVITDGEENSSCEWTKDRVKALVAECQREEWQFLFLGADIDAFGEAGSIGVSSVHAMAFTNMVPDSVAAAYSSTSDNLRSTRRSLVDGASMKMAAEELAYSPLQRAATAAKKGQQTHGLVHGGSDPGTDEKTKR